MCARLRYSNVAGQFAGREPDRNGDVALHHALGGVAYPNASAVSWDKPKRGDRISLPFFLFGVLFFQFKSDAQQQFQEFRCFFLQRFRGLLREGYRFFHW
jgi:hypothetical protein